ncbi:hypothetical protein J6590_072455 [Homalodisca vitripennis]|nr:hypothetical protein J6590_072455 [Homalodisca vitripennis]
MTAIANAFVLYRESRPQHLRKKCHLYSFIKAVGKSLGEKGGMLADAGDSVSSSLISNRLTDEFYHLQRKRTSLHENAKYAQKNTRKQLAKLQAMKHPGGAQTVQCHFVYHFALNITTLRRTT